jgi:hypothetical protein
VSICLLDTGILCEFLEIPGHSGALAGVDRELAEKVKARESLLLPMSAIVETGNHVAQVADGRIRRFLGQRFAELVRQAIQGQAPFTPTPFFETDSLLAWLDDFPDWAMRGAGFADLTIVKEFERQCSLHRIRRIYIWSLDGHLAGYRRDP